jgi:hypothetical protein
MEDPNEGGSEESGSEEEAGFDGREHYVAVGYGVQAVGLDDRLTYS